MAEKKKETPRLEVDPDKPNYNVRETGVLMDITPDEVRQLIRDGKLAAKKYGATYIVRRENIEWWLEQQKLLADEAEKEMAQLEMILAYSESELAEQEEKLRQLEDMADEVQKRIDTMDVINAFILQRIQH